MKGICIALVLATATGFVTPPAAKSMQTVRQGTLDGMVGAGEETGGVPWDPMGFSKISEMTKSSEHDGNFPHPKFLREAELKHGRVAMLAFMGVCVQKGLGFHWPGVDAGGFYFDATAPWYSAPTSAFATNAPGMAQILVFIGVVEGQSDSGPFWRGEGEREAGDLNFYPFGKVTGDELVRKQKAELKNGRLAMIAVMAFVSAHYLPGSVPFLNNLDF